MKTQIDRIYLDLDDVLNTLTPYALWWVGCPVEPTSYSKCLPSYNIVAVANRLLGLKPGKQFTKRSFWNTIPRQVWAEAPESQEARWLLRTCKRLVDGRVYIATCPTKDPDCLAGKLEWIQSFLPRWMRRQYAITPRKHLLAQPGSLLIDDCEQNCQRFEACGGIALRFPRPWNPARLCEPRSHLRAGLARLFGCQIP